MAHSADASRRAAQRAQMRASGLRVIEIWVPDTHAPGFAEEARRQSLLIAAESDFDDIMGFIERNGPEPVHRQDD
ncbi:MAG: antitoxin MazE family protein [Roseomonas sp.]